MPAHIEIPKTSKQWVVTDFQSGFNALKFEEKPIAGVGPLDVLVMMKAASLNYRDLIIPKGLYPFPMKEGIVPCSDGAGEVIAIGAQVKAFQLGDKVATVFNQGHQYGALDEYSIQTGLGGVLDGCLREFAVFPEYGLVKIPDSISYEEAATLPCAALTAWNALYGLRPLRAGESVLVQGTGGVSMFALQFAKAAGAFVVATTSTNKKADVLVGLGADAVVNYRNTPEWGAEAKTHTPNNAGFDHIVEVGGINTLPESFKSIKYEGIISVIGFIGGVDPKKHVTALDALSNVCTLRGILVGSKAQMQDMIKAIDVNEIKPVIDEKTFRLEEAREAYHYMWEQKHFGKLVIKIND
ncbi:hypothetical protein RUND412_003054 [Rhizina undulata]